MPFTVTTLVIMYSPGSVGKTVLPLNMVSDTVMPSRSVIRFMSPLGRTSTCAGIISVPLPPLIYPFSVVLSVPEMPLMVAVSLMNTWP